MGALDAKIRKTMQVELKRIQREVGITFLYVTHDQDEAMALGDRIAVMHGGRYEDLGAPQRVYDEPATQFVAEFLGACNLLPVTTDQGVTSTSRWRGRRRTTGIDGRHARISSPRSASVQRRCCSNETRVRRLSAPMRSMSCAPTVTTTIYLGATSEYETDDAPGAAIYTSWPRTSAKPTGSRPGDQVIVTWERDHGFALPAAPATRTGVAPTESDEATT